MSNKDLARRTELRVTFQGIDISADVNKYLLSLDFTDNEGDKADDLQLALDDGDWVWLGKWLNPDKQKKPTSTSSDGISVGSIVQFTGTVHYVSANAIKGKSTRPGRAKVTKTFNGKHPYHLRAVDDKGNFTTGVFGWVDKKDIASASFSTAKAGTVSSGGVKVGDIVTFKGGSVYVSSTATKAAATRGESKCKVTIVNKNTHPYHLISQDGKGVYGWVDAVSISGSGSANESAAMKGAKISAVIVQKNWNSDGKDRILPCGEYEVDSVNGSGPPAKVTIKGTAIPYTSSVRSQKKTRAWENIRLSAIAKEIASKNKLKYFFESDFNPLYKRVEQIRESDIAFLKRLCKRSGITLKVTGKIIVLFDAQKYEAKKPARTIRYGSADLLSYQLSTGFSDTAYSKCHVSYTDPKTKKKIEYTFSPSETDKSLPVLEVNEKVSSVEDARKLAMKRLREKNKGEFKVQIAIVGDVSMVVGVTVSLNGFGAFDGKYIIETAKHSVSGSGYKAALTLRRALEGY